MGIHMHPVSSVISRLRIKLQKIEIHIEEAKELIVCSIVSKGIV